MRQKRKELLEEIDNLKRAVRQHRDQNTKDALTIAHLHSILRGERVCDGYCERCEHGLTKYMNHPYYPDYQCISMQCDLDCKCPDFRRKE